MSTCNWQKKMRTLIAVEIILPEYCLQTYNFILLIVGCLDTLTIAKQQNLVVHEEAKEKTSSTKVYTKDDFSVVNRFESKFSTFS